MSVFEGPIGPKKTSKKCILILFVCALSTFRFCVSAATLARSMITSLLLTVFVLRLPSVARPDARSGLQFASAAAAGVNAVR